MKDYQDEVAHLRGYIPHRVQPIYSREEPHNRLSLLTQDGKQVFTIINATARYILSLCDGQRDLPAILAIERGKFTDQSADTLAKDLLSTADKLTRNCLLYWMKEEKQVNSPFEPNYTSPLSSGRTLYLADASRHFEIEQCAQFALSTYTRAAEDYLYYSWDDTEEELENQLALRQRLFTFTRDFFPVTAPNNSPAGLIVCEIDRNPSISSVQLKFACMPTIDFLETMRAVATFYSNVNYRDFRTFRVSTIECSPLDSMLNSTACGNFFTKVGVLPCEIDSSDVNIYSHRIK